MINLRFSEKIVDILKKFDGFKEFSYNFKLINDIYIYIEFLTTSKFDHI